MPNELPTHPRPTIGVFDSGFGGLTVLRALLPLIPGAHYIYLGDTARLPYGAKSQQTIARYALSSAAFLQEQGIQMLVVACNTASALALEDLTSALPIPVIGVITPGVLAAHSLAEHSLAERSLTEHSPTEHSLQERHPERSAKRAVEGPRESPPSPHPPNHSTQKPLLSPAPPTVLVLATTATVQSSAYTRACAALGLVAHEKACPLLVPLVEEGWIGNDPITTPVIEQVLRIYLTEALAEAPSVTTLLLGCTHYPLLAPLIARTLQQLNHPLHIVDSAAATARAAAATLGDRMGAPHLASEIGAPGSAPPVTTTFYATDSIQKFQRLGSAFLGQPLPQVTLIDLGG